LKGTIKSTSTLELADEQRGSARGGQHPAGLQNKGILMDKTVVNFMKAPDSQIKIKSSSKKLVSRCTFDVFY
jgi:vesicle-fusing ATPase